MTEVDFIAIKSHASLVFIHLANSHHRVIYIYTFMYIRLSPFWLHVSLTGSAVRKQVRRRIIAKAYNCGGSLSRSRCTKKLHTNQLLSFLKRGKPKFRQELSSQSVFYL